jgi:glycosyltransferase involved in cell wall biosynthesis
MRIIIVRSTPISPEPRLERVAQSLSKAGDQVSILGWDRSAMLPSSEELEYGGVTRMRWRSGYGKEMGNTPAMVVWLSWLLNWLWQHRGEYEVIHACNFDTILPALIMKLAFRKIVVYDIFDFYAEMLRATPRWIIKLIRALDLWAIGRADAVILADDCRREQIKGANPKSVTVIYNSPEDVLEEMGQKVGRETDPHEGLRVAFIGLLHVERGLVQLLEVFSRHPEWKFDLAGFGGDEDIILPMAAKLANVAFHGRVDYEVAISLMHGADALIATYDPRIPNHRYASPNKLFEAMMLAKPIVVARGTNMDCIVEGKDCGLVVDYGDVKALERALQRLADDPGLRASMGAAGRKAYDQEYNWEIMRQRLVTLYHTL